MASHLWAAFESNPEVMTKFLRQLGLPVKWKFVDVYGLDPEMLAILPEPVLAIILLYPMTTKLEEYKEELEKREEARGVNNKELYFIQQIAENICGTIAMIHCVANNLDAITLEKGKLKDFINETKDLDSVKRGEKLMANKYIYNLQEDLAEQGQLEDAPQDGKLFNHYIALVQKNGAIYELDGRKPFPVYHGASSSSTFLIDAANVCKEYMKRDPENVQFNIIALTVQEDQPCS